MASGEYRRHWHNYFPLPVLNFNTTYHSSPGFELSLVPYNTLDHKLGLNPYPRIYLQLILLENSNDVLILGISLDRPLCHRKGPSNDNYIVRKLSSNKTQILHRIRLRKCKSNTTLQDIREER